MGSKLTLSLPDDLHGLSASASIMNHDLAVVRRMKIGTSALEIDLDPGIYAARAVLPDGRSFEAAFEIGMTGEAKVKLKGPAASQVAAGLPYDTPGFSGLDFDAPDADAGQLVARGQGFEFRADTYSSIRRLPTGTLASNDEGARIAPSLSLVMCNASGHVLEKRPIAASLPSVVRIDPEVAGFLCIKGAGEAGFCIAAPTSESEWVEFRFVPGQPASFAIKLQDERADLLLQYLDSGRIEQLSLLVADYWSMAETLLQEKHERPVAATVGAYVILLVGPPDGKDDDYLTPGKWLDRWTGKLFWDFPWLVDGLCIRAEMLARRGAHTEALDLLLTLPGRDLPMFSLGLRFALNRLTSYCNAAAKGKLEAKNIEAIYKALDALHWIAAHADFDRPVLSFERPAVALGKFAPWPRKQPGTPSNPSTINTGRMPMSNTSIEDDVFPRDVIPDDALAKEFNTDKRMDDSDAYLETGNAFTSDDPVSTQNDANNWRAAKSLKQLQAQVNQAFPNRKKTSDGLIGDTAHCPGTSDHCPNIVDGGVGVVTGYDITHDPANGCDMANVTNAVITSKDRRIKYIIYASRICSSYDHGGVAAWTWRAYSGANPHTKHAHFSVLGTKAEYDDTSAWSIVGGGQQLNA